VTIATALLIAWFIELECLDGRLWTRRAIGVLRR
jgi:hypothetical protein